MPGNLISSAGVQVGGHPFDAGTADYLLLVSRVICSQDQAPESSAASTGVGGYANRHVSQTRYHQQCLSLLGGSVYGASKRDCHSPPNPFNSPVTVAPASTLTDDPASARALDAQSGAAAEFGLELLGQAQPVVVCPCDVRFPPTPNPSPPSSDPQGRPPERR